MQQSYLVYPELRNIHSEWVLPTEMRASHWNVNVIIRRHGNQVGQDDADGSRSFPQRLHGWGAGRYSSLPNRFLRSEVCTVSPWSEMLKPDPASAKAPDTP